MRLISNMLVWKDICDISFKRYCASESNIYSCLITRQRNHVVKSYDLVQSLSHVNAGRSNGSDIRERKHSPEPYDVSKTPFKKDF